MYKYAKILFLFTVLFSLTQCEEREELNARKAADEDRILSPAELSGVYNVVFTSTVNALATCPAGSGASVTLNFNLSTMSFIIPINNTNGIYADYLDTANTNNVLEGSPALNSQTGEFSATYAALDLAQDFDDGRCLPDFGAYDDASRMTLSGSVSTLTGDISGTYQISSVCTIDTNDTVTVICSGTF